MSALRRVLWVCAIGLAFGASGCLTEDERKEISNFEIDPRGEQNIDWKLDSGVTISSVYAGESRHFRFDASERGEYTITLNSLSGNADLFVLDETGKLKAFSQSIEGPDQIRLLALTGGKYTASVDGVTSAQFSLEGESLEPVYITTAQVSDGLGYAPEDCGTHDPPVHPTTPINPFTPGTVNTTLKLYRSLADAVSGLSFATDDGSAGSGYALLRVSLGYREHIYVKVIGTGVTQSVQYLIRFSKDFDTSPRTCSDTPVLTADSGSDDPNVAVPIAMEGRLVLQFDNTPPNSVDLVDWIVFSRSN